MLLSEPIQIAMQLKFAFINVDVYVRNFIEILLHYIIVAKSYTFSTHKCTISCQLSNSWNGRTYDKLNRVI